MNKTYTEVQLKNYFIEAKPEVLLTTKVVSAYMDLSISWFNYKASKGDGILFRIIGNKRMYKKQDVLNWINRHCPLINKSSLTNNDIK